MQARSLIDHALRGGKVFQEETDMAPSRPRHLFNQAMRDLEQAEDSRRPYATGGHALQPSRRQKKRSAEWGTTELPVPADLLVHVKAKCRRLSQQRWSYQTFREAAWLYVKDEVQ